MPVTSGQGGGVLNLTMKAWVYVRKDGSVVRSFNVSGVTRTAQGRYQINFQNAMASAAWVARVPALSGGAEVVSAPYISGTSTFGGQCSFFNASGGAGPDTDFYMEFYE